VRDFVGGDSDDRNNWHNLVIVCLLHFAHWLNTFGRSRVL
jgi:hypothetical protein